MSPLELQPGMKIVLEALSPTDASAIAGVTVTNLAIYGNLRGESPADEAEALGPFMFVPGPQA
jgi:hypothetical protein